MKKQRIFVSLLLSFITLISGQIIFGTPVFGITAPTITINLDTLPQLNTMPGNFGSVSQTVGVTTNNYTGYTATLTNSNNVTDLINTTDNTLTIPTITLPSGSSSITSSQFDSGYGISTDGTNYVPAPTSSDQIQIGTRNSSGTGSHTLTFGAKPASDTKGGLYTKTFIITAVANNPQYQITFEENAGTDTVTNMPSDIGTTTSSTGTVTLPNNVPARSGYAFLGWDEDDTATTPTYTTGNTNTITLEPTQANAMTLYAIWESTSHEIHDTTTTVYSPSAVPAGYTVYFDNPNIEGNPVATADANGNITSFEYTNTGTNGISFSTGHSLNTGIIAFDGTGFTIHLKIKMNSSQNGNKYLVSAMKPTSQGSQYYAGFVYYCYNSNYFYLNASQSSTISGTGFGSRINNSGWRVTSGKKEYILDIVYTPSPNKSISATFTPVYSGSSSFYTDSTNLNYIPDTLEGATITLSGDGNTTSRDLSNAKVLEFSVTKNS